MNLIMLSSISIMYNFLTSEKGSVINTFVLLNRIFLWKKNSHFKKCRTSSFLRGCSVQFLSLGHYLFSHLASRVCIRAFSYWGLRTYIWKNILVMVLICHSFLQLGNTAKANQIVV